MSNADAMAAMKRRIQALRTIPQALPYIAQSAVGEVRDIIAANVAAQRGPDGKPWPVSEDGKPVLAGAMAAVDVRAVGTTVVVTVDGVNNRHHLGRVKGGKARPIIPSRSLPQPMSEALDKATTKALSEHLDG